MSQKAALDAAVPTPVVMTTAPVTTMDAATAMGITIADAVNFCS